MIDFNKIINKSHQYNFHTHTQYCDGRANIEEFVVEAIKQGFVALGFTPHSPILVDSICNMKMDDVGTYIDELISLRNKYSDKIDLYTSMEIDYFDNWGPSHSFFKELPLDYRIGSIHFIPSFKDSNEMIDIDGSPENFKVKMSKYFDDDIKSVVESFHRQSVKMIDKGGFEIIGHFDKIGFNACKYDNNVITSHWYSSLVKCTFDAIMDNHLIIEINTKAYAEHNRFFPDESLFELVKKYNAPVLINSDAHFPHLLNAGRKEALQIINI